MYNIFFFIIVAILLFDFITEFILDWLNTRSWRKEIPPQVAGLYDAGKYAKSQQYFLSNLKFGWITATFSLAVMLAMLFAGGFAVVDKIAVGEGRSEIIAALIFFGILALGFDILQTPFSLYHTFSIEEKFGFNKTTWKIYLTDKIKSWILGAVIGGGLLTLIILFYQWTGKNFWFYAWGITMVFMVFFTMFYSNLIVPLFNKQTPLEDGELKDKIHELCRKAGYTLDNIFVIDGSKRSTKANAYFSGLGPKKRIVLYDTLINDLEPDEIVAVLAHETGHYKKRHTLQGMALSVVQTGLTLYILSLFIDNPALSQALGVDQPSFHTGLVAFALIFSPVSTLLGVGMNVISRKNEFVADRYAAALGYHQQLASGLKKLSVKHLSNLTPHPAYVFVHYSHPPLLHRLEKLEETAN
ncbi:MAG: M48 family metallopeptidase [Chlorobi bacterium]|nr:M48 family metallopeptidase [Chlorobiota bacterium]